MDISSALYYIWILKIESFARCPPNEKISCHCNALMKNKSTQGLDVYIYDKKLISTMNQNGSEISHLIKNTLKNLLIQNIPKRYSNSPLTKLSWTNMW